MKAILFNIHDLVLLLTLGICALLAGIFVARKDGRQLPRYLLSGFFGLNALTALDKLIFWGEAFKYQVFDFFPLLLLLFSFAIFASGPLLYWYAHSKISTHFSLKPTDYLHLLPAIATPVYLYLACFQFPLETQRELLLELKIYDRPGLYFSQFINLKEIIPVVYGVLTLSLLLRHWHSATGNVSNNSQREIIWLKILVGGFLFLWSWALVTHLYGSKYPGNISDLMGIAGNYLTLILIVTLMFFDLSYLGRLSKTEDGVIDPQHVTQIRNLMEAEKPFLNPGLTLERFAELVELSPRLVSQVVNRSFDQNFHEYINRYRVDEAKRILGKSDSQNLTIQEVAQLSGFNSKSTFNRFFKSIASVTPGEYRQNAFSQTANK